jgi:proteasome assembly chaperone (PAC2) family protein
MAGLQADVIPELHDPVVVVAFSGWNDAANAATDAARYIIKKFGARKFATIEADEFYDFRETRPRAEMDASGARHIAWMENDFFYARNPTGPHDIVVAIGVEPDLAWRTFSDAHMGLYQQLRPGLVISLGALLADVPHTRPTRVTGTALDPDVAVRLDLTTSRYEGPTGIVGVLHDALRRAGFPAASLWANVPHYITTSSNPLATAALLIRLQEILGYHFDLEELRTSGERFVREVNTALAANPDVVEYVRKLESRSDEPASEDDSSSLPGAEELLFDVEEFLRRSRDDD